MTRDGQVSLEYLLITGFAFMFSIPMIIVFYSQSHQLNEDVTASQADRIASEIVEAADEVYYLGEPSKKTIRVYMPQGVESVTTNGKDFIIRVQSSAGEYEVVKSSAANLSGSLGTFSGIHVVEVEARLNDVLISE